MIQEYNPSIEYTPGKANVIADALSRKAYCNNLILKPFQLDLCEAFHKLNLFLEVFLPTFKSLQLWKIKFVSHNSLTLW